MAERGLDFVGQEVVNLSTTPVWHDGRIEPRPFVLRIYAARTPEGWNIMPGGFCRISGRADARAVSMGEGVQSADVWVLADKPVAMVSLLPTDETVRIRRIMGTLPSRAAEICFGSGVISSARRRPCGSSACSARPCANSTKGRSGPRLADRARSHPAPARHLGRGDANLAGAILEGRRRGFAERGTFRLGAVAGTLGATHRDVPA